MLALQAPLTPRTADGTAPAHILPIPVPEIGIEQTEAQPVPPPVGMPVRVEIPSIGVDANVVTVGLVGNGKLDVPAHPADVGWYELGAFPGQNGNAVLDGHLDIGKTPGVFYHLRDVNVGDVIRVTDHLGTVRGFRVREAHVYPVNAAPMEKIFGEADGKHLNIITCAGVWRKDMNHYDKRLVVFADLIEE